MLLPDKLLGNPAERDERFDADFKFIMDDRILPGLNSQEAPLALQMALIPVGSLKGQLYDATERLDKAVKHYMSMRAELVTSDSVPSTEIESVKLLQRVMEEVKMLYDAYDLYSGQIKAVRANVLRHLDLFVNNGRLISQQLDSLLVSNSLECIMRSYGIQLSMKEYQILEETVDASWKSTLEVIVNALRHFMDIIDKSSESYERLAEAFHSDVDSDDENEGGCSYC